MPPTTGVDACRDTGDPAPAADRGPPPGCPAHPPRDGTGLPCSPTAGWHRASLLTEVPDTQGSGMRFVTTQ